MARPIETELRKTLIETNLNFIIRGKVHIDDIYDSVHSKYPNLCDDAFFCSHNGYADQPEWKHIVRGVINTLKKSGIVNKDGCVRNYWNFT